MRKYFPVKNVVTREVVAQNTASTTVVGDEAWLDNFAAHATIGGAIVALTIYGGKRLINSFFAKGQMQDDMFKQLFNELVKDRNEAEERNKQIVEAVVDSQSKIERTFGRVADSQSATANALQEMGQKIQLSITKQAEANKSVQDLVEEIREALDRGEGIQDKVLMLVNSLNTRFDRYEKLLPLFMSMKSDSGKWPLPNGKNRASQIEMFTQLTAILAEKPNEHISE